jgi:hypothetical protein
MSSLRNFVKRRALAVPAIAKLVTHRNAFETNALGSHHTQLRAYLLAEMLIRIAAAVFGLDDVDCAVVGDVQPIANIGEMLMGMSEPRCRLTYYQRKATFHVPRTLDDLRPDGHDLVIIVGADAASEQTLLNRLADRPGRSLIATRRVICWRELAAAVEATLTRVAHLPTCLNPKKLLAVAAAVYLAPRDAAIFECGVFHGGTTLFMALLQQALGRSSPILGFDTFTGMPRPDQIDMDLGNHYPEGFFSETSDQSVRALFTQYSVQDRITLHPGMVQDTLPKVIAKGGPPGFVLLDMDAYAGIHAALSTLLSIARPDSLFLVDDVGVPGVDRAITTALASVRQPARRVGITFNLDAIVPTVTP